MPDQPTLSPARALTRLLALHQEVRHGGRRLPQRQHHEAKGMALAALQRPGGVEAFVLLSATLPPLQTARFAMFLARALPREAPLQETLCATYAAVVQTGSRMQAQALLTAVHDVLTPGQPIFAVVAQEIKNLEARSSKSSKPQITRLRRAMLGKYAGS